MENYDIPFVIGFSIIVTIVYISLKIRSLNIDNGLCEFSKKYIDIHDYPKDKGGDGTPTAGYIYTCPNCGKEFTI